jgi:hypothetical protein
MLYEAEYRAIAARIAGMRRDLAAVINGLMLEHSSGAVEGNLTRVKRLRREATGGQTSISSEPGYSSPPERTSRDHRQSRIT